MNILGFLNIIFVRIPIVIILGALLKRGSKLVHPTIVILVLINAFLLMPRPYKKSDSFPGEKPCFHNQRIITNAIEMYNIDKDQKMTSLDLSVLLEEKYLKELPQKPIKECEYYSEGDISKDGYIACKRHRSFELICRNQEKEREEEEKTLAYKITNYFPNLNDSLIQLSNNVMEFITRILNWLPFGNIFFFLLLLLYCAIGFTIQTTTMPYLIASIISFFIVLFEYLITVLLVKNKNGLTRNNNKMVSL